MKKCLSLLLALSLAVLPLTACGSASAASNGEVVVYNWGEYIDPETISMFEEETGIKAVFMMNLKPTKSCIPKSKPGLPNMMLSALPII